VSTIIDLSHLPACEAAAHFIARLAFPEGGSRAAQYAAALGHLTERGILEVKGAPRPGITALLNETKIERLLKLARLRHDERMAAALMARPFLMQLETGTVTLPQKMKHLSLSAVASWAMGNLKPSRVALSDPPSTLRRIWKPSRPVLPAAVALERLAFDLEARGEQFHIMSLMVTPWMLEDVVARAEKLEPLLERLDFERGKPVELLRFRYMH
jgi:hypothetical protein